MREIILASGSPRRRELLTTAGIPFEVIVSDTDEQTGEEEPDAIVKALSEQKCLDVLQKTEPGKIILGADTIVAMDGVILGKPQDAETARRMLLAIQGRTHEVYTGVTLAERRPDGSIKKESFAVCTEVEISPMSQEEIDRYASSEEPLDKAGAYGIQGAFSRHVEGIRGDYFNVVGLPVHAVYEALKRWQ